MEKVHSQGERIAELEDKLEYMVIAAGQRPVAAGTEEPNATTESTEEAASEAANPGQVATIPLETETSPDSEVTQ